VSEVVDKIVAATAETIADLARAACTSRTLRQALRVIRTDEGFTLNVPHYWAQWFHDGRGVVTARPGHKLVFYKNPAEDPRIAGGYPVRLSDVRKLSREEFYRDLRAGKLIVAERVGPAGPNEFMGDALTARAGQIVAQASADACQQAVRDALGPLFKASVETKL
jgi:hypothetical protein